MLDMLHQQVEAQKTSHAKHCSLHALMYLLSFICVYVRNFQGQRFYGNILKDWIFVILTTKCG